MRRTMTIRRALLRDCRCATVREADIIIPSSPHMHKPPLHCALCSSMRRRRTSHDLRMTKRKLHHARFVYPDVCTYPGTHVYHAGNMCLYNADHARRMPNLGLSEDSSSEELGWAGCPAAPGRPHVGRDAEGGLKLERSGTAMVSPVRSHTSDTTVGVDTAHDHRTHTGELGSGS